MRRKHNLDDDNFERWDDFSGFDCNIDDLAGSLDLDLDFSDLDFTIDPDSSDFSLDSLNDFD